MDDKRYWVGNGGNWSSTSHWSTTSGGASGASVPTASQSAIFDANSFSSANQVIVVDSTARYCNSLIMTGVTNNPELRCSQLLITAGDIIIPSGPRVTGVAALWAFGGNGKVTVNTIIECDVTITDEASITLYADLKCKAIRVSTNSTFALGGYDLTCTNIRVDGGSSLDSGNSTININSSSVINYLIQVETGNTADFSNNTINVVNTANPNIFPVDPADGQALTFGTVNITNTTGTLSIDAENTFINLNITTTGGGVTFDDNQKITNLTITKNSNVTVAVKDQEFQNMTIQSGATVAIQANNDIQNLIVGAGSTTTLTAGTTQTIENFISNGTPSSKAIITSNTSSSKAYIEKLKGTIETDYLTLTDIGFIGNSVWYVGTHTTKTRSGGLGIAKPTSASVSLATPDSISGLIAWHKADEIVGLNDGDAVSTWNDNSGNGYNLAQATGTKQPLYKTNILNSKPTVRFDGSNDFMQSTFTLSPPYTIFVVYKHIALGGPGAHDIVWDGKNNVSNAIVVDDRPYTQVADPGGVWANSTMAPANGSFSVVTQQMPSGSNVVLRENGSVITPDSAANPSGSAIGGFTIGSLGDGSRSTNLDVAEIIIYNSSLSAGDITIVESYLADKYTLTVAGVLTATAGLPDGSLAKRFIYRVFNPQGVLLGEYDDVISEFSFDESINTIGSTIKITLKREAQDFDEGNTVNVNNKVEVWVQDDEAPDGEIKFQGYISGYKPLYDKGQIEIEITSYGELLDKTILISPNNIDVSFLTENLIDGNSVLSDTYIMDSFTTGSVSNVSSIALMLSLSSADMNGTTCRLKLFTSKANAQNVTSDLSIGTSANTSLSGTAPTEYNFIFSPNITVSATTKYYWRLEFVTIIGSSPSLTGNLYTYGTNSGGEYAYRLSGTWYNTTNRAYIKTYSGSEITKLTFNQDISQTIKDIIDSQKFQGGIIDYTPWSIETSGVSASVTFNADTIAEGIKTLHRIAPDGWYYYIDQATNILYFKAKTAVTTIDHRLVLGKNINDVSAERFFDELVNVVYFVGGPTAGVNLFKKYTDTSSLATYGKRAIRINDGRITATATADKIAESYLDRYANPLMRITGTIIDSAKTDLGYDIESIQLGQNVALRGFVDNDTTALIWDIGNWDEKDWAKSIEAIDDQILQVVKLNYTRNSLKLTLANLPRNIYRNLAENKREITILNTQDNPTAPS